MRIKYSTRAGVIRVVLALPPPSRHVRLCSPLLSHIRPVPHPTVLYYHLADKYRTLRSSTITYQNCILHCCPLLSSRRQVPHFAVLYYYLTDVYPTLQSSTIISRPVRHPAVLCYHLLDLYFTMLSSTFN